MDAKKYGRLNDETLDPQCKVKFFVILFPFSKKVGFTFKEDVRVSLEKGYDVHLLACRQMIVCKKLVHKFRLLEAMIIVVASIALLS